MFNVINNYTYASISVFISFTKMSWVELAKQTGFVRLKKTVAEL